MRNNVIYLILRYMLDYIDDLQLHRKYALMTLGVQVHLLISWYEYVQVLWGACQWYTMVYELTKVYTNDNCHQYAQKYIFLLHTQI